MSNIQCFMYNRAMKTFEEQYSILNKQQKKAVDTIDGPVFVMAGPGTGKTQILTLRIANILKEANGIDPENILALTYAPTPEDPARITTSPQLGFLPIFYYRIDF